MKDKDAKPTAAPVWSKGAADPAAAEANVRFCAGFDVHGRPPADLRLVPHDLDTNAAHLIMLVERGIVPRAAAAWAARGLLALRVRHAEGTLLLRPGCEDVHMSIEAAVTDVEGPEAGGVLHTGRSRNDQVATDMRLWMRGELAEFADAIEGLAEALATHAEQHTESVCPGFTHGQPAMVTSWGHWVAAYLPRVLRTLNALNSLAEELEECPLGAAASFGTSWPLDRQRTASLLGFKRPTLSGADGIWSRGELEGRFAFAMAQHLAHLAGIGQDLILLSTPPREWLRLADEHVTGSSIMPQKRNPDFAEVARARAAHAGGIAQSLLSITSALPSGYNRDTQWTKYLVFDAADNARGAAPLCADVFRRMNVYTDRMRDACSIGFLNATDVADSMARLRGLPFRRCYRILGAAVQSATAEGLLGRAHVNEALAEEGIEPFTEQEWAPFESPEGLLSVRDQPGNPHPARTREALASLRESCTRAANAMMEHHRGWERAREQLWHELERIANG